MIWNAAGSEGEGEARVRVRGQRCPVCSYSDRETKRETEKSDEAVGLTHNPCYLQFP